MKKILYSLLGACLFFAACEKESAPSPSLEDRDWFVIEDNPSDPLDHLIYTVYETTGIPVFYSDTIGQEERGVDENGKPYMYQENLNVFYEIRNSNSKGDYEKSDNAADITRGVEFLRDYVIPRLKPEYTPLSYFLVNTLTLDAWSSTSNVYRGMRTTVIAGLAELKDMSEQELQGLATEAVAAELSVYLYNKYDAELQAFYSVSNDIFGKNIYGMKLSRSTVPSTKTVKETYGIIEWTKTTLPTELQDVSIYLKWVLADNKMVFEEKYGDYSYVLDKYDILRKLVVSLGFIK